MFCRAYDNLMDEKINNLFTIPEVAEKLRLGSRTIYRLIEEKKLPAIKISRGAYRITKKDLTQFLKKHRTK